MTNTQVLRIGCRITDKIIFWFCHLFNCIFFTLQLRWKEITRLLEDMSAPRTLCPTKCHSSLGTTSVGGFLSLMSGCSLLHTANQSKAHNPHQAWIQAALNFKMKSGVRNSQSGLCSFSSNLEIRLGEHNIWEPDGTEQHIMSAEFIRHPDYDSRTQDSDIMLIKLSRPAALSSYVRPAVLPSRCASEGTVCQVSGWGNLRPSDEGCKLNCAIRPICVAWTGSQLRYF